MTVAVLLGVGGLVMLTFAADHLVMGAGRIAARLRIAPIVVGVVVIGLGTSAPEFLVSGLAAHRGDTGLAVGNLVGSNMLNLTLILGVAALVAPLAVRSSVPRQEAPLTFVATVLFALSILLGLGAYVGAALSLLLVITSIALVKLAKAAEPDPLGTEIADYLAPVSHRLPIELTRTVLGLAGTLGGAQLLVINASKVATELGVSQTVIGFTLVAFGTSLPELVTAIQAQRRGESDLLVGNLLGSNLFNCLGGGAVIGLAHAAPGSSLVSPWLLATMIATTAIAWLALRRGHRVTRPEAFLLISSTR